jgi:hypothetical protein
MAWWGLSSLLYNPHVKQYADPTCIILLGFTVFFPRLLCYRLPIQLVTAWPLSPLFRNDGRVVAALIGI